MWFTSDLHFGHSNIIGHCNRPFGDVEEMNWAMVERWNDRVRPRDEIVIVGDFALGRIQESIQFATMLHGRKMLVCGNHDRPWIGHKKAHKSLGLYLEYFDQVEQEFRFELPGFGRVLVNHLPAEGDSRGELRWPGLRPQRDGSWDLLLHGHLHGRSPFKETTKDSYDVGVDAHDYAPVSLDEIRTALLGERSEPLSA